MEGTDGSFKYEDVYLKGYERVPELEGGLRAYFECYNTEWPHQFPPS
ncbi:MAG TPA: hypothetical protein VGE74_00525 [Gemmata sp.]